MMKVGNVIFEPSEMCFNSKLIDSISNYSNEFQSGLLKYAFEHFRKGEYFIATKEYSRISFDNQSIEVLVKMSVIDKEDSDLFKGDNWQVYDFSNYNLQTWINLGFVPRDKVSEYYGEFKALNKV